MRKVNGADEYSAWEPRMPDCEYGEAEGGWGRIGTRAPLVNLSDGALGKDTGRANEARLAECDRACAAILDKHPEANGGMRRDGKIIMKDPRIG